LVQEVGLRDQIIFAGPRFGKEKFDILMGCDLFVHTSRWEGLPFAVLEALATGKPALITTPVGFRGFFEKYDVGLRTDITVDAIAGGLCHFASLPKEELQKMGALAREAVLHEFSWRHTSAILCRWYYEYGARRLS
jgi:glycosyltransferase involved in cell wall biosynthesis